MAQNKNKDCEMDANLFLFKQKSILYIEDDKTTRDQTASVLKLMFKNVFEANSAKEALKIFDRENVDLILADIGLPDTDGLSLVKTIRAESYRIPIVMLTCMSASDYLFQAANLAVDGYIVKPFELGHLIKSLAKAFMRSENGHQIVYFCNQTIYNATTQEMSVKGVTVSLGKKERELLSILVRAHPKTVSPDELSAQLWPMESVGDSALKNLVMRMRKKLGDELIQSVKSAGYRVNMVSCN